MESAKNEREISVSQQKKGVWNVSYKGRYFQVNDITKHLIICIIKGLSNEDTLHSVSKKFSDIRLEHSDIDLVRKKMESIEESHICHKSAYIKFKKTLVRLEEKRCTTLLKRLSSLFDTKVVVVVMATFFSLLLLRHRDLFCVNRHELFATIKSNPFLVLLYIVISIGIIFIHEMGHAVASERYKVSPKEIGFGFYLYFPVFFTDVSRSWMATRRQRIVIDVAGFYFQIISMTILLLFSFLYTMPNHILFAIILDNLIVIIYNMNPLFRFDGYWIFSDIFGITNLRNKSYFAIAEIVLWIGAKFRQCNQREFSYPILVYLYSCISLLFVFTMVSTFVIFAFRRLVTLISMLMQNSIPSDNSIWIFLISTILLFVGVYFSSISVIQTTNTIKKYVLQLRKESSID
ncbi:MULTISPECIES: M50 family metallopeptidase [Porphyromonas]|uniref:Peptide zinc metalloprotease protein n=1 Tax=Porphyromonas cangingivalis TaxID=36874 RepID=A0A1T4KYA4_PORCN|nr:MULTISPECIES: M50 family metallopeptidase [Porphyromonas]SJZ47328.1 hypothetical protein SAMN02745205_00914 [Porphyromonas cangingivalis]VEJ04045.1 Zn-dependent proteases [Porphyromonas cangingivalis]